MRLSRGERALFAVLASVLVVGSVLAVGGPALAQDAVGPDLLPAGDGPLSGPEDQAAGSTPAPGTTGETEIPAPVGEAGSRSGAAMGLLDPPRPLTLGLHMGPEPLRMSASLPLAAELGASLVPVEFAWERVQPTPERFAWEDYDLAVGRARSLALEPVGVLLYPAGLAWPGDGVRLTGWPAAVKADWLAFVHQVVTRYAHSIAQWIVVRDEPPDADPLLWAREAVPHARFVQETVAAIRSIQPAAKVRAAVSALDLLWLEVFVREGGLARLDGLVLEANRWPAAPEGLGVVIDDVRGLVHSFGYDPELWVWRFGYPTHVGVSRTPPFRAGVTEEQQAQYLLRSHVWLAQAGVPVVLYQELMDSGWERDVAASNFGLYTRDGQAKPAATAYRILARQLGGRTYGLPQPVSPEEMDDATVQAMGVVLAAVGQQLRAGGNIPAVAVHPFAGQTGDSLIVVLWSTSRGAGEPVAVVSVADLALPEWVRLRVTDALGQVLERIPVAAAPVYLEIAADPPTTGVQGNEGRAR